MALTLAKLSFAALDELKGGLIQRMGDKALERVAQDLLSAPDIEEWRSVKVELRFKPTMEDGQLGDVAFEFTCDSKLPKRVTSATMQVKTDAQGRKGFFHNVDSPDEPRQMSLLPADMAAA